MALKGDLVRLHEYVRVPISWGGRTGIIVDHERAGNGKRKYKLAIGGVKREQFCSENDFEIVAPRWK